LAGAGRAAQVVEAAVARDPVEPRARVDRPAVGDHRVEGGGEDLLEHVLGVLRRVQHVTAEREQARLIALYERLECPVLALAGELDELLVALQAKERRATREARKDCR